MVKEGDIAFEELTYQSLVDYAWEDINTGTAKIYLTKGMEGIKKELNPDNVQCDFEPGAVDLKIRNWHNKNWRFRVEPLFDTLAVEKCKLAIKSNSISITLGKENLRGWTSLKFVKKMTEDKKQASKGPDAELMTLMKDLY